MANFLTTSTGVGIQLALERDNGTYERVTVGTAGGSVPAYTATPDAVQLSQTSMQLGNNVVADPGAKWTSTDVGKLLLVVGAGAGGLQLCTTIARVLGPTSVLAAAPAQANVAGVASAYGTDNQPAVQALIAAYAPTRTTIVFGPGAYMFGRGLLLQTGTRLSGPGVTLIACLGSGVQDATGCLFLTQQATDITPTLAVNAQVGDAILSLNGPAVRVGDTLLVSKLGGSLLAQAFVVQAVSGAAPQLVTLDRAANAGIVQPGSPNVAYTAGVSAVSRVTNPVSNVVLDGFTVRGRSRECFNLAGLSLSVVSNLSIDTTLGDADVHWFLTIAGAFACRFQNITIIGSDAVGFGVAGAESIQVDGYTFRGKTGISPAGINFNGAIACRVDRFVVSRCATCIADFGGVHCGFANGNISDFSTYGTNHSACASPYLEDMIYSCTGQGNAMVNIDNATVGFCGRKLYLAGGFSGMLHISDGSISAKWQQIVIVPNSDTATDQMTAMACAGSGHTTVQGFSVVGGGTGRWTAFKVTDPLAVANTVTVDGFDVTGNDTNVGGLPVVSVDEAGGGTSKLFLKNGRINGNANTSCVQMGGGKTYVDTVELLGPAINGLWVYQFATLPTLRYKRVRWVGAFSGQTLRNDNSSFVNQGTVTLNGATPVNISFTDLQPNETLRLAGCTNKNGATAFDEPVLTNTPGTGCSVVSVANDSRIYQYEIS